MSKFINIIINPVGDLCNLKCRYCYTLSREKIQKKLSLDEVFTLIDYLSKDGDLKCINFTWHGGEPLLMGIDYLEKILLYQKLKLSNVLYHNIIQSNGLLIDNEWINLIKRYKIDLGVSIDGPDYSSNSSRFLLKEEFEKLIYNLELLKRRNCAPALFCTLTEANMDKLDSMFNYIETYQPHAFMFNPVMDKDYAIPARIFADILIKMKKFSDRTGIINTLTYHIDSFIRRSVPQLCLINGMCHKFISMDNNGSIYASCVNHDKNYLITNIKCKDAWEKVEDYINKRIVQNKDSIFMRLGQNLNYKYFQGNGCTKCRTSKNNEEFVRGVLEYIKYTQHSENNLEGTDL